MTGTKLCLKDFGEMLAGSQCRSQEQQLLDQLQKRQFATNARSESFFVQPEIFLHPHVSVWAVENLAIDSGLPQGGLVVFPVPPFLSLFVSCRLLVRRCGWPPPGLLKNPLLISGWKNGGVLFEWEKGYALHLNRCGGSGKMRKQHKKWKLVSPPLVTSQLEQSFLWIEGLFREEDMNLLCLGIQAGLRCKWRSPVTAGKRASIEDTGILS
ncbi:UNVERIFIED_CONTAM: hypothetical protein K2H54_035206 [Gekko kuhli]